MKQSTLKGFVHVALAAAGVAETLTAKTVARKFLLGAMIGFHAFAVVYHLAYEEEEKE